MYVCMYVCIDVCMVLNKFLNNIFVMSFWSVHFSMLSWSFLSPVLSKVFFQICTNETQIKELSRSHQDIKK